MMHPSLLLIMALLMQAICAPADTDKVVDTYMLPGNMSYEDLLYIVSVKNGVDSKPPKTLSPCARAILGCCGRRGVINETCSEDLKCGAFFFDDNPCAEKFVREALRAAKSFYDQINSVS